MSNIAYLAKKTLQHRKKSCCRYSDDSVNVHYSICDKNEQKNG